MTDPFLFPFLCVFMITDCLNFSTPRSSLPATRWKRTEPFFRRRSAASCWSPSCKMPAPRQRRREKPVERKPPLHPKKEVALLISVVNWSTASQRSVGRKPSRIFLSHPKSQESSASSILFTSLLSIYHNTSRHENHYHICSAFLKNFWRAV